MTGNLKFQTCQNKLFLPTLTFTKQILVNPNKIRHFTWTFEKKKKFSTRDEYTKFNIIDGFLQVIKALRINSKRTPPNNQPGGVFQTTASHSLQCRKSWTESCKKPFMTITSSSPSVADPCITFCRRH